MKHLVKSIYDKIPFKKEIFKTIRKVWRPRESVYKHLSFKGSFKVVVEPERSFQLNHYGFMIENEIFWEGIQNGWEKESLGLWLKLCRNSNYIMDLGANTGVFSLVAKSVNPNAKVYAFEPVKRVFDKLRQNVRLNGYDVQCVEMAVSNNDGSAVIYDMDTEHILSVTVNHNYLDPSIKVHEVPIETICLNTFIRENNIPNIDLMKIDVETHEPQVLEGFSDYLSRFRPTMLIEILNNEIGEKVEGMIKGLGYLFYNIDENKGIRKVDKIEKSDYFNYLLCNEKIARGLKLPV